MRTINKTKLIFTTMMNMKSKNQYLVTLIEKHGYLTKNKKEKSKLLDEYCHNTGQNRKYVIRKIRGKGYVKDKSVKRTRKRKEYYDGSVKTALVVLWRIFDCPCGQRLKTLLETETERLRGFDELSCSDETAKKLTTISSASIDRKLVHAKEIEQLKWRYSEKRNSLLYQKIPIKTASEQKGARIGFIQTDLVAHCGQSAAGEFVHSLSCTDIDFDWWEGEAFIGRAQERTFKGLKKTRKRFPFPWDEIHSDNDPTFINWQLYRYCQQENLGFSRSRPYQKNDNCFVEQKNSTHIRKHVGHLRYDTKEELDILNSLYRNELRLYKNFFQPTIKLKEKIRIKGKVKRKYGKAKTPYQRAMESKMVSEETKKELRALYESLNPAELKRNIDAKLKKLYQAYQRKKSKSQSIKSAADKKLKPVSVTFLNDKTRKVLVT